MSNMFTNKSRVYSLDGNIGSGKSTIIDALKKKKIPGFVFVHEPLDEWDKIRDENNIPILQLFYSDKKKYSFPFQMMAYISRLAILVDCIEKHPDDIIITERSLDTDRHVFAKMLYDDGCIEDVCMEIYLKWFDAFIKKISIKGVIFIKATSEKCLERIAHRARDGEDLILKEYLDSCNGYYDKMIDNYKDMPILHIDGNIDYDSDGIILENRLREIIDFCTK